MRKFISAFLVVTLLVSLSVPCVAASSPSQTTTIFDVGSTRIDIVRNSVIARNASDDNSFEIHQYYNNQLQQVVYGEYGGTTLTIVEYCDDVALQSETISVADIITSSDNELSTMALPQSTRSGQGLSYLGRIYCDYSEVLDLTKTFYVYGTFVYEDVDTYEIESPAGTAVSTIIGALLAKIGEWFEDLIEDFLLGVFASLGIGLIQGAIEERYSDEVIAMVRDYDLFGYDSASDEYTYRIPGSSKEVLSKSSEYYSDVFYEGATPDNWKDEAENLAYIIWYYFYDYSFPGISGCS